MADFCTCDEFAMDDREDSFGFLSTDAPFPLPVDLGGTGGSTVFAAQKNLGVLADANSVEFWEMGAISSSTGANSNATTRIRTSGYLGKGVKGVGLKSGYRYILAAYSAGSYIGTWNGSSFTESANWRTTETDLTALPDYDFRIVLARNPDSGNMTTDLSSNLILWSRTTEAAIPGVAADAQATRDAIDSVTSVFNNASISERELSVHQIPFTLASIQGSIEAETGNVLISTAYFPTDFVNVSGLYALLYKRIGSTGTTLNAGMAFYDKDKNYISGKIGARGTSATGYLANLAIAIVPESAAYARFTTYSAPERGDFELYGLSLRGNDKLSGLQAIEARELSPALIAQGGISPASGANITSSTNVRTVKPIADEILFADCGDYSASVHAYSTYSDGTVGGYKGALRQNGQFSASSATDDNLYGSVLWTRYVDIAAMREAFPDYYFRLAFCKADGSALSPNDAASVTVYQKYSPLKTVYQHQRIVDTVADYYALFEEFVTGGFCTKTLLATVQDLPIYQYDFTGMDDWVDGSGYTLITDTRLFDKHQALITSGMHGDEKNATVAVYEFCKNICYNPLYRKYLALFDFHVIPICNPTGYNLNTRNNYQDKNINRIDEASDTVECQAIMAVIDSRAYDLYIDCHTMRRGGQNDAPQEIGIMSFANATPEETLIREWRTVMRAGAETETAVRNLFMMDNGNNIQHFFPWLGQAVESFRQYGLSHEVGGVTVGAPISGTFECSDTCYIFSKSTLDNNGTAQFICVNFADNLFRDFLDGIIEI